MVVMIIRILRRRRQVLRQRFGGRRGARHVKSTKMRVCVYASSAAASVGSPSVSGPGPRLRTSEGHPAGPARVPVHLAHVAHLRGARAVVAQGQRSRVQRARHRRAEALKAGNSQLLPGCPAHRASLVPAHEAPVWDGAHEAGLDVAHRLRVDAGALVELSRAIDAANLVRVEAVATPLLRHQPGGVRGASVPARLFLGRVPRLAGPRVRRVHHQRREREGHRDAEDRGQEDIRAARHRRWLCARGAAPGPSSFGPPAPFLVSTNRAEKKREAGKTTSAAYEYGGRGRRRDDLGAPDGASSQADRPCAHQIRRRRRIQRRRSSARAQGEHEARPPGLLDDGAGMPGVPPDRGAVRRSVRLHQEHHAGSHALRHREDNTPQGKLARHADCRSARSSSAPAVLRAPPSPTSAHPPLPPSTRAGWKPPFNEEAGGDGIPFDTKLQTVNRLQEGLHFEDGERYTRDSYRDMADAFKRKYLETHQRVADETERLRRENPGWSDDACEARALEEEFWRIVETDTEKIRVEYGSDLGRGRVRQRVRERAGRIRPPPRRVRRRTRIQTRTAACRTRGTLGSSSGTRRTFSAWWAGTSRA